MDIIAPTDTHLEATETAAPYERNNLVAVRIDSPTGTRTVYMHDDTESALTRVTGAVRNATRWPDQIDEIMQPVIAGLMARGTWGVRIAGWSILISVDPQIIAQIYTI